MSIDYNHQENLHTQKGACAALPIIFSDWRPNSLLDVGCGAGTWLKAALECGILDVFGVDGVAIPEDQLLISPELFLQQDLTLPWNLNRRFDVVLCLEVAEHLESRFAEDLIQTLTRHADIVVFSAACPGQGGQHHVNCKWPTYWQQIFNDTGFVCGADIRWQMWQNSHIEPWYRQNIFIARRDPVNAGQEERIISVIHPELLPALLSTMEEDKRYAIHMEQIEDGSMNIGWYLQTPLKAVYRKLRRKI